jgi:hypothetical protein
MYVTRAASLASIYLLSTKAPVAPIAARHPHFRYFLSLLNISDIKFRIYFWCLFLVFPRVNINSEAIMQNLSLKRDIALISHAYLNIS